MNKVIATAQTQLKASVLVKDAIKQQRGIKKISTILISAGPLHVATATVSGEYNSEQALTEFKRNPKRFQPGKDFDKAKALTIV